MQTFSSAILLCDIGNMKHCSGGNHRMFAKHRAVWNDKTEKEVPETFSARRVADCQVKKRINQRTERSASDTWKSRQRNSIYLAQAASRGPAPHGNLECQSAPRTLITPGKDLATVMTCCPSLSVGRRQTPTQQEWKGLPIYPFTLHKVTNHVISKRIRTSQFLWIDKWGSALLLHEWIRFQGLLNSAKENCFLRKRKCERLWCRKKLQCLRNKKETIGELQSMFRAHTTKKTVFLPSIRK